MINTIFEGDCIEGMRNIPDQSVNCCVTSPPYFGLRDYGHEGQIGLEETPEQYVAKLVDVFREVKRVLKNDGTLWCNLGDSYWGGKGQSGTQSPEDAGKRNKAGLAITSEHQQLGGKGYTRPTDKKHDLIKGKDLIGIPWMVAFALRADGWYLRQDIIWHKPNPMPESVTDRCTKSHEYIFLLSKSKSYYYDADAIKQAMAESSMPRLDRGVSDNNKNVNGAPGQTPHSLSQPRTNKKFDPSMGGGGTSFVGHKGNYKASGEPISADGMANKRSVWTVTTKPYTGAHFATYPEDLIVDCIKAGCPEGGIVLDPFMGAGTTALVSRKLHRQYVGFELNPEYIRIAKNRLQQELGMFV